MQTTIQCSIDKIYLTFENRKSSIDLTCKAAWINFGEKKKTFKLFFTFCPAKSTKVYSDVKNRFFENQAKV